MGIKKLMGWTGVLSLFIGGSLSLSGYYLVGFSLLLLGFTIAFLIMFWGFSGRFLDVIDKHTHIYSEKSKKWEGKRRKW
jgi:hypothetical protein